MVLNDPLANVLSAILNAETRGKRDCLLKPVSKVIKKVLEIMQDNHYIGSIEEKETSSGKIIKANLIGNINKCGVIKPRYSVNKDGYEKFEKRYLPAQGFGIIIVSTSTGIMIHEDAKKKKIGGKLLLYCY